MVVCSDRQPPSPHRPPQDNNAAVAVYHLRQMPALACAAYFGSVCLGALMCVGERGGNREIESSCDEKGCVRCMASVSVFKYWSGQNKNSIMYVYTFRHL